jgi:hypothetical protein
LLNDRLLLFSRLNQGDGSPVPNLMIA